jgi:hypothetical protein
MRLSLPRPISKHAVCESKMFTHFTAVSFATPDLFQLDFASLHKGHHGTLLPRYLGVTVLGCST